MTATRSRPQRSKMLSKVTATPSSPNEAVRYHRLKSCAAPPAAGSDCYLRYGLDSRRPARLLPVYLTLRPVSESLSSIKTAIALFPNLSVL